MTERANTSGSAFIVQRVIEAFDRDETAAQFLRDDGEGGFAAGIYRMAREIDRLREKCGEPHERDPSWQDKEDAEVDTEAERQIREARNQGEEK